MGTVVLDFPDGGEDGLRVGPTLDALSVEAEPLADDANASRLIYALLPERGTELIGGFTNNTLGIDRQPPASLVE